MTKMEIRALAEALADSHNPYKEKATKLFVDGEPKYIWGTVEYDENGIRSAYIETAMKDIKNGYEERMVGYYDKWYRYNHADNGRAYDAGCRKASTMKSCKEDLTIIECEFARY